MQLSTAEPGLLKESGGGTAAENGLLPSRHAGSFDGRRRKLRLHGMAGYLFIMPAFSVLTLFFYIPAGLLFIMAFYHWNLFGNSTFAGWANFSTLFNQPLYFRSLAETAYFAAVMVPADTLAGLALALLLREGLGQLRSGKRRRGGGIGRSLVFLPHVTPVIATSIIWAWVFNPRYGLANYVLRTVGLGQPGWLDSTRWAMPAVMLYSLWHSVGYYAVFFLAGLAMVPDQVLEAAKADGASRWYSFRRVVLPMISPTIFMVAILSSVASMQAFSQIYALSGGPHGGAGGPAYATTTDALLIYNTAFIYQHISLAAAMSLVLFLVLLAITLIQKRLARRWVYYGGDK